jgi:hypothetical protein
MQRCRVTKPFQDYLLSVLETPLEVRERQFCSGGQCVRVGDCVRIKMSKPSVPSFADRCDDRLEPDNYLLAFRYSLPDFLPAATLEGACLLLRPFQHLGHRHRIACRVAEPRGSHLRQFQLPSIAIPKKVGAVWSSTGPGSANPSRYRGRFFRLVPAFSKHQESALT